MLSDYWTEKTVEGFLTMKTVLLFFTLFVNGSNLTTETPYEDEDHEERILHESVSFNLYFW